MGGRGVILRPTQEPVCLVSLQHLGLRSRWRERRAKHHDAVPRRVCAGHLQPGEGRHAVHPGRAAGGRRLPQRKCPEQGSSSTLTWSALQAGASEGTATHARHTPGSSRSELAGLALALPAVGPPCPGPFECTRKPGLWLLGFHIPTGTKAKAQVSRVTLETEELNPI